MNLNEFPSSPSEGDTYLIGNVTYKYTGGVWNVVSAVKTNLRVTAERLAKEAGFSMVAGSFDSGATVTNPDDVIWDEFLGKYYSWSGAFPKVVSAGSKPETSGGISVGAWADKTDLMLRTALAADNSLVGFKLSKTGAILRTLFSKSSDFTSVKDFGAVGDGVADDTAAIDTAIANTSALYFPEGVYLCSGMSFVNTSNKYLFGCGEIKSTTNQGALIGISGSSNIVIEGLTLTGKVSGTIDRGINIELSHGIIIRKNIIKNFNEVGVKYGLTHTYVKNNPISIIDNDISYCGTGIYVPDGEYANISGNRIRLCGTIWSANSTSIDNFGGNAAVIGNDSGWGIVGALGNCRVENNHIQENFYGMRLDGSLGPNGDHSHILGNQINHNQAYGFLISNTDSCEQIGFNEILSTVGPGVWPTTGTSLSLISAEVKDVNFSNNTVDGGSANKVILDNVIHSTFSNNIFYSGSNVEEVTRCQDNTWFGNNFMGNSVGVIRNAATTRRTFFANTLNNTSNETVPVGVTFASSWRNYDSAVYFPMQYWRDAEGYLNVRGVIKSTNTGDAGGTICTLPAGFRPSRAIDVVVKDSSGVVSMRLYSTGGLQMLGGGTTKIDINFRIRLD